MHVSARPRQGFPVEAERRGNEFHFDSLLLGPYSVYLEASPGTPRDVVLERDAQRLEVSLPWPEERSISGVVLDEHGQPAVEGCTPRPRVAACPLPCCRRLELRR